MVSKVEKAIRKEKLKKKAKSVLALPLKVKYTELIKLLLLAAIVIKLYNLEPMILKVINEYSR